MDPGEILEKKAELQHFRYLLSFCAAWAQPTHWHNKTKRGATFYVKQLALFSWDPRIFCWDIPAPPSEEIEKITKKKEHLCVVNENEWWKESEIKMEQMMKYYLIDWNFSSFFSDKNKLDSESRK